MNAAQAVQIYKCLQCFLISLELVVVEAASNVLLLLLLLVYCGPPTRKHRRQSFHKGNAVVYIVTRQRDIWVVYNYVYTRFDLIAFIVPDFRF